MSSVVELDNATLHSHASILTRTLPFVAPLELKVKLAIAVLMNRVVANSFLSYAVACGWHPDG